MQVVFTNELDTSVFDLSFFQKILSNIEKLKEQQIEPPPKN